MCIVILTFVAREKKAEYLVPKRLEKEGKLENGVLVSGKKNATEKKPAGLAKNTKNSSTLSQKSPVGAK